MPHSIAVDGASGDVWVTDVALHQVIAVAAVRAGRLQHPRADTLYLHTFCPTEVQSCGSTPPVAAAGSIRAYMPSVQD